MYLSLILAKEQSHFLNRGRIFFFHFGRILLSTYISNKTLNASKWNYNQKGKHIFVYLSKRLSSDS